MAGIEVCYDSMRICHVSLLCQGANILHSGRFRQYSHFVFDVHVRTHLSLHNDLQNNFANLSETLFLMFLTLLDRVRMRHRIQQVSVMFQSVLRSLAVILVAFEDEVLEIFVVGLGGLLHAGLLHLFT